MKWWWSPWRKAEWLRMEALYKMARWDLHWVAVYNPTDYERERAACEALKPEGWTREIERRRWNRLSPRASRWSA